MLKENIIKLIDQAKYSGYTVNDFATSLKMDDADNFKLLIKSLNEMEDEYILGRDDKNRYFRCEDLGYVKGVLKINAKGFGFVDTPEESYYVSKENIGLALQNDVVMAKTVKETQRSSECEIVGILEHHMKTIVGVVKIKDGEIYFLPDTFMNYRKISVSNYADFKLVNDSKVLLKINSYGKTLKCQIEKILGHKYDPGVDILSILLKHDIEPEFPQAVLNEVKQIPDTIPEEEIKNRKDLRDIQIITIDGEDAKDLDDAISVEKIADGYRLGVHIADVSFYVQQGSAIDQEAYRRGTSVYVVDRVVPMLPHALCNGICSLNPQVDRLAMTCMMDIDKTGEITNYQIFPSVIKTTERMTYTNVNHIIDKQKQVVKKYQHILLLISNMLELSTIIRKRRVGLGSIDFDSKESKILVDEKGRPTDIILRERGEAERIIEDFMICANECVAMHTRWLEVPSMYRIHETPEPKKIREFARMAKNLGFSLQANAQSVYPKQLQDFLLQAKDAEEYPVLSTYLLRSMQKARYDTKCLGHFGLALENYTHFTSPIRRYPDLIVHRMLRTYCVQHVADAQRMHDDEIWLEECAQHSSLQERKAVEAERDVDDLKKSEYMEKYVGCVYNGIVSGITKFGMFVELDNTVEGLVHVSTLKDDYYHYDDSSRSLIGERTANVYAMGKKVTVRVTDANHFKREIDFEIVKKGKELDKHQKGNYNEKTNRNNKPTGTHERVRKHTKSKNK